MRPEYSWPVCFIPLTGHDRDKLAVHFTGQVIDAENKKGQSHFKSLLPLSFSIPIKGEESLTFVL
jgi:hypothetical protein